MAAPFTHLHTHSFFSFHDGVASPADLAQAAAQMGLEALALTDHDGLTGAIEFYAACRERSVRPILGLEVPVAPPAGTLDARPGALVLLAMDIRGWRSLCRLSSALLEEPQRDTTHGLPFERFCAETAGLVCLTGGRESLAVRLVREGLGAEAALWLGRLAELFDDRLYVELAPAGDGSAEVWARLADHARRQGTLTVATNDVHTLGPEQAALQRTLTAIRLNRTVNELPPEASALAGTDFISGEAMAQRFAGHSAAVARTAEVADRCRLELPLGVPHYPEVRLPTGVTALEALHARAHAGARELYGQMTPEIEARLAHELSVIGERGYAPLFLIMEEIMTYARATGVPTSSRGSAASSLVAHCLGITSPDPLRLNLYFERFLNPARASPPDIDTDLCSRRRDGVIRHVYETYGDERVAMVCTLQRYRARSALREAAKAFGFSPAEITEMASELPYRWWGPPDQEDEDGDEPALGPQDVVGAGPFRLLAERHTSERHRRLFEQATGLLGLPRHLSVHPGGVVITPGPMTDLVPRYYSTKGVVITQFDLESVARLGLLKIDLLGIRGLTVLGDMVAVLPRPAGAAGDNPLAGLEAIDEQDAATRDLLRAGRTIGCFQIESPGMRATLKEVGAGSVDDLMVALALYRPGPLTGGLKEAFVQRHLGRQRTEHLHPALEKLLGDTFGVFLYQEQVLRVAHELAGLSLAEADLLRRAMSHFDPGQQMVTLKQKFVAGCLARHQVPRETAERVWELMAAFAGYGFPKAHAASYAQVAWRAAWCKAHFPAEFMAAVLANWGGYYGQQVYLTEARRWGLKLRPPHINHAGREFSVVEVEGEKRLYMGLNQVRDLTQRTTQRLLRERPFASLADFLARANPRAVEAENLVRVGALTGLGTIPALLRALKGSARRPGQMALFGGEALDEAGEDDWSLAERVGAQQALLGVGVDAHPLELVPDLIEKSGAVNTVTAAAQVGRRVRVAGTRMTWHRTRTARGDYIYFMALEDLDGMLDVVIFGDVNRRYRAGFGTNGPLVVEGQVEMDPSRGEPIIRAERAWALA